MEENFFTILWWVLPHIEMNHPQTHINTMTHHYKITVKANTKQTDRGTQSQLGKVKICRTPPCRQLVILHSVLKNAQEC